MPLAQTTKSRLLQRCALALVSLLIVVLFTGSPIESQAVDNGDLRERTRACVPDNPPGIVEEVLLAAQAEVGGRDYYWFYAYDAPIPEGAGDDPDDPTAANTEGYPGDLVISVDADGECREEWFNPMGDPIPLSEPLGQQVARMLTLDRYERTIDRIGRDGLQTRIDSWVEYAEDFGERLRDEEQWALEQLGMEIPPILIE